jgi:CubicO group peptidase (beta-lactamase class C family)
MDISRRHLIGFGAATAALSLFSGGRAWAGATQGTAPDLSQVIQRVRAFAEADLASKGLPGMQIALIGPGGAAATMGVGLADIARRIPATPEQLFQIGSITKSLTAMALFVLAEKGPARPWRAGPEPAPGSPAAAGADHGRAADRA